MAHTASAQLPAALSSAGAARTFVRDALRTTVEADVLETVELLTSELVTNALLHASAAPIVAVTHPSGTVRISVTDSSPQWPACRSVPVTALSGRGVALVDALASAWGVERVAEGKRVWFEIRGLH